MSTSDDTEVSDKAHELLASIAKALNDVYTPSGVLIFWSARIKYLDDQRPCDVWREQDLRLLQRLDQRVNALADGAFA